MIGLNAVLSAISIVVLCLMTALLVVVLLFIAQEFWSHVIAPALLSRKNPKFVSDECFTCDLSTCAICFSARKKGQEKQDG